MNASGLLLVLLAAAGADEMKPWARVFLHHAPPKGGFTRVLQIVYGNSSPDVGQFQVISRYVDFQNRRMREEMYPSEGRRGFPAAVLYNGDDQYSVHPMDPYFLDQTGNTPIGELPWEKPSWGRRVGAARVLGRPCELYEQEAGGRVSRKVCVWRGIVLREEMSDHVLEALYIDERATVPEFIMNAKRLSRIEYPTGNPHDICRVDTLEGENINRYAYFDDRLCRERVCEAFGPVNAERGTASVCLFREKELAEYGTEGMERSKLAAAKAWLRHLAAQRAGRAADARKALGECRKLDPENERCKAAARPARLKTLQPLAR